MELLEIEIKFPVPDILSIRKKIEEAGAVSKGRHFEVNARFDDATESLKRRECLLRLRNDSCTTLTFKSKPADRDPQFKVHRELEVQVSDFAAMEQILNLLGYQRRQTYEKWRETFQFGSTHLCLDQMPFGDFVEIEGSRTAIRNAAARLELDWNRRIRKTYLELFSILKDRLQLGFSDITFENFKDVTLDDDLEDSHQQK